MVSREPVQLDARRSMTPARRKRILARYDGQCARIGCCVSEGLEIDHIICLALGGKDRDDNCEPLCGPHHKVKTALDLKLIAKAKRRGKKDRGERKVRRPIQSRGFDKTRTRKFNGEVVPR